MSLADDIQAEERRTGVACFMETLRATDPKLADEVSTYVTGTEFSGEAIARALRKRGLKVSGDAVRAHRNGECDRCRTS